LLHPEDRQPFIAMIKKIDTEKKDLEKLRQKSDESVKANLFISASKFRDLNKINSDQIRNFEKDL